MTSPCDSVAERLALGEPLGADDDAHVAACPACARLVRVPRLVAATARDVEPAAGFASRVQVGARHELAARRRNRVAAVTLASAAAVLVGGVFVTRHRRAAEGPDAISLSDRQPISVPADPKEHRVHDRGHAPQPGSADRAFASHLVRIADIDAALAPHAPWHQLEEPLVPYEQLLLHVRQGAHR